MHARWFFDWRWINGNRFSDDWMCEVTKEELQAIREQREKAKVWGSSDLEDYIPALLDEIEALHRMMRTYVVGTVDIPNQD